MADELPALRVDELLARARSVETLEAGYAAWGELNEAHASAARTFAAERKRLAGGGQFLLGAVKAAGAAPEQPGTGAALARRGELDAFVAAAEAKLAEARVRLDAAEAAEAQAYGRATAALVEELTARAERQLARVKTKLTLFLQRLPGDRAILQVDRLAGDAPVMLLYMLHGLIPTRYGYFEDESTEDLSLPPARLYADDGAGPDVRPGPEALERLLAAAKGAVPLKAQLPFFVGPPSARALFRLVPRGRVAEVERAEPGAFRGVLTVPEAESVAGLLLRLKLEGKLSLELEAGEP